MFLRCVVVIRGDVSVGAGGLTMVVLVACTLEVEWSSWWAPARVIRVPVVHGGSGDPCSNEPGVIPT